MVAAKVSQTLLQTIRQLTPQQVVIAYSGGVDSSVLLHIAADCLRFSAGTGAAQKPVAPYFSVLAVHINHGVDASADDWEHHCRCEAERINVPFASVRIDATPVSGQSPEENLRIKRYAALCSFMQKGDLLLTGHHQDDQAETVLLQLLRGAGAKGLAAMSSVRKFDDIYIVRPMLDISRCDIEAFAKQQELLWIEDPSNEATHYSRNYLRHRVIPVLAERWPNWKLAVNRVAAYQAETALLLEDMADQLVASCVSSDGTLDVARAISLDESRKRLLLRRWLQHQNLPVPGYKQINHLLKMYLSASHPASAGLVCWKNAEVRCYRGRLYAMKPLADIDCSIKKTWSRDTELALPEIGQQLSWHQFQIQMPALADVSSLTVQFRQGGERYFHAEQNYHQSLKKVFQQLGVPPWQRNRIPLIYYDDELRLIWGYSGSRTSAAAAL